MVEHTFSAKDQVSQPVYIGPEQRAVVSIAIGTPPLDCTIAIEYILSPPGSDSSQPNDNDIRWTIETTKEGNTAPHTHKSAFGGAWFRANCMGYVSGEATIRVSHTREA